MFVPTSEIKKCIVTMSMKGHSARTDNQAGMQCFTPISSDQNVTGMSCWENSSVRLGATRHNTMTKTASLCLSCVLCFSHCYWPAAGYGRVCVPGSALLWRTRWRVCSGWAGRWSPPPSPSSPRWWWWSEQTPVQLHKIREREIIKQYISPMNFKPKMCTVWRISFLNFFVK